MHADQEADQLYTYSLYIWFSPSRTAGNQTLSPLRSCEKRGLKIMVKRFSFLLPLLLLLLLSAASLLVSSGAEPIKPRPQALRSFKIRERESQVGWGCSYTVRIKTSCSSPRYTRDAISLAFGDAYHNEVYAPRLDDPSTATFERCSTDTFKLTGPCGYGVCYLYLRRQGWDGWIPEWVQIYEPRSVGRPITFYYGTPLPNAVWYGFNHCPRVAADAVEESKIKRTGGDPILISQM